MVQHNFHGESNIFVTVVFSNSSENLVALNHIRAICHRYRQCSVYVWAADVFRAQRRTFHLSAVPHGNKQWQSASSLFVHLHFVSDFRAIFHLCDVRWLPLCASCRSAAACLFILPRTTGAHTDRNLICQLRKVEQPLR